MAKLTDLHIVYSAYTEDMSNAADRRRFPYFVKDAGASLTQSRSVTPCDLAYITDAADLSGWCDKKARRGDDLTLVLEFVDMHFHYPPSISQKLKGTVRFATGRESRFNVRFTDALKRACHTADMIVCASDDQREMLLEFNDNVHITLDRFETRATPPKSDFSAGKPFRIGWEGQPHTLNGVNAIAEALNSFSDSIELHVITDIRMKRFGSKITQSSLSQIPDVTGPVIPKGWSIDQFQTDILACDAMILPLDQTNYSQWAKPANRMLSLWHLNMPVISSSSRAFKTLQDDAGLDFYASSLDEWRAQIRRMIDLSAKERARVAKAGFDHAKAHYNDTALMERWVAALASVGIETA